MVYVLGLGLHIILFVGKHIWVIPSCMKYCNIEKVCYSWNDLHGQSTSLVIDRSRMIIYYSNYASMICCYRVISTCSWTGSLYTYVTVNDFEQFFVSNTAVYIATPICLSIVAIALLVIYYCIFRYWLGKDFHCLKWHAEFNHSHWQWREER